jgi:methylated-DNA-protein-cysteine methyltransferase-like protein
MPASQMQRRSPQTSRTPRTERIIERVRAIPEGYVRTFADIDPAAPRLVGRILASNHDLPWHRVVRADGTLPQGQAQLKLLLVEGVPLRGDRVDLTEARLPPEL